MSSKTVNIEYIDTNEARKIIKNIRGTPLSLWSLISWIRVYGIGKKVGGRWWINKAKLVSMLEKGNPNGT